MRRAVEGPRNSKDRQRRPRHSCTNSRTNSILAPIEPTSTPKSELRASTIITALEEKASAPTDLATLSDHLSLLRRWYYRPEKQRAGEVFFPREDHSWPIRRILRGAARMALGEPTPMAETHRELVQRNPADEAQKPTRTKVLHEGRPDVEHGARSPIRPPRSRAGGSHSPTSPTDDRERVERSSDGLSSRYPPDIISPMAAITPSVAPGPMAPRARKRFARPSTPRRLPHVSALDGIRGLAALTIVMHHCLFMIVPNFPWPSYIRWIESVCSYFYLGVDLFFVLSGYLITSLLLLARRSPNFYHDFYWKRVFRILPPLLLVLLATHFAGWTTWPEVFLAIFFIANFRALWHMNESGPFWSLSIEEQFYLVWPTVVRNERPRTMQRTLLALMIVPAVLRVVSVALHHGRMHYTFVHCDGLAWGAFLAMLAYRARIPFRDYNNTRLWQQWRWLLWSGACLFGIALLLTATNHLEYGLLLSGSVQLFSGVILYLLTHRRGLAGRFFSSGPMQFLGNISYMMYLSHTYLMNVYDRLVPGFWTHPTPTGYFLRFLAVTAITLLLCAASLYFFERPIGRLRRFVLRSGS